MARTFVDFPVYKKSLGFVEEVEALCGQIKWGQFNFLKDQLRRAASSIVLNIAEGSGKWSKKDKTNFYRISQASANECLAALDLLNIYRLTDPEQSDHLKEILRNIALDLHALKKSIERR